MCGPHDLATSDLVMSCSGNFAVDVDPAHTQTPCAPVSPRPTPIFHRHEHTSTSRGGDRGEGRNKCVPFWNRSGTANRGVPLITRLRPHQATRGY